MLEAFAGVIPDLDAIWTTIDPEGMVGLEAGVVHEAVDEVELEVWLVDLLDW